MNLPRARPWTRSQEPCPIAVPGWPDSWVALRVDGGGGAYFVADMSGPSKLGDTAFGAVVRGRQCVMGDDGVLTLSTPREVAVKVSDLVCALRAHAASAQWDFAELKVGGVAPGLRMPRCVVLLGV